MLHFENLHGAEVKVSNGSTLFLEVTIICIQTCKLFTENCRVESDENLVPEFGKV